MLFLLCAVRLFHQLGYSILWTFLALLALLGQNSTLYYVGEARPYFPLASATLGTLVYYLIAPAERRGWIAILGWVSITLGASFHPYFIAYWSMIVALTFLRQQGRSIIPLNFRSVLAHVNVPLAVIGNLIYFGLALNTWLKDPRSFSFDPFQYVPSSSIWETFINYHFEFISPFIVQIAVAASIAIFALMFIPKHRRGPSAIGLLTNTLSFNLLASWALRPPELGLISQALLDNSPAMGRIRSSRAARIRLALGRTRESVFTDPAWSGFNDLVSRISCDIPASARSKWETL
jgi:hypothetical protein